MAEEVDRLTVVVTGAGGFVGTALVKRLRCEPHLLVRASSRRRLEPLDGVNSVLSPELTPDTEWGSIVRGADVVVHLAARVHVMREQNADPLTAFRTINAAATANLARQAARAGVRRFVYLSSVKVNGEETPPGHAFTERDPPMPLDPYGISKHEAEIALDEVSRESGMEFVVIRPPLVYGPAVKGNFRSMMHWLCRGVPLPLGAIHNRRSLVALDNLVDLIVTCLRHPAAGNQIFLVSDGEDMSTTQLLRRLARALDRPARLISVPMPFLRLGLALVNKGDIAQRLCGSLQIDISQTHKTLNWSPPVGVEEGLRRAAIDYIASQEFGTPNRPIP